MNPYNHFDVDCFDDAWVREVKEFKKQHPEEIYYPMSIYHFEGILNDFRQVSKSNQRRRLAVESLVLSLKDSLPKEQFEEAVKKAEQISGLHIWYK